MASRSAAAARRSVRGDVLAGRLERRCGLRRQSILAEVVGGDQRAMHQQIGIAPDRGGEVRIALQRQSEVPEILRRIDRRHLRSQGEGMDHRLVRRALGLLQQPREVLGPDHLAARQLESQPLDELPQGLDPHRIRLVVHAVHAGPVTLLQRFRRRDVGRDHEFLDQAMGVEACSAARCARYGRPRPGTRAARGCRGRACRAPRAPSAAPGTRHRAA